MAQLTPTQEVTLTGSFTDAGGNPALIDGDPRWEVADAAVATVIPTADPAVVVIRPVGPLGSTTVTLFGDADTTTGVREISGVATVDVVAGEAATATITEGTPVDQPVPPVV
jgi:hypothetical protein